MIPNENPGVAAPGFSIPILLGRAQDSYRLLIAVYPFDDVVADYTSHDGDDK